VGKNRKMKSTRALVFIIIAISILFVLVNKKSKKNTPREESKLTLVLKDWEKNGGDLSEKINKLSNYSVETKEEAQAICHALSCSRLVCEKEDSTIMSASLHALLGLFQNKIINSEEAYNELGENGLPHLRRFFVERFDAYPEDKADDLLSILKILAMYGDLEDLDFVIKAAHKPLKPDSYKWSEVLGQVTNKHPGWEKLCDSLRSPLPKGFLCVAYLDFANNHAMIGGLQNHPFNSSEGILKIKEWLSSTDDKYFDYAVSATTALPFIADENRHGLLEIAKAHPDITVRIETAWVMTKIGDPDGRKQLQNWCLDVKYSWKASGYLEELGYKNDIPASCLDPDFHATAEMCNWLSHPNEYNKPPDKIEMYDKRELYWPPTKDTRKVWLFKYTYNPNKDRKEAESGVGMVGGAITFALCGTPTANLSPEDIYGLHCSLELREGFCRKELEIYNPEDGRKILRKYNKGF
jgi:hypothetical protein